MHNFTSMQKEIIRAINLHGGITPELTERHGWTTRGGLPTKEFQQLINPYKVVAPRVLTSIPLKIVWQFRNDATKKETLAKIEREARRLGLKEHAVGGFQLTTSQQDRARGFRPAFNTNPRQGRGRGF